MQFLLFELNKINNIAMFAAYLFSQSFHHLST